MKTTKVLFGMATFVGLGLASCSNNELEAIQNSNSTIKAMMEAPASTKIGVTEAGVLTWSEGDEIGIYTSENSSSRYTLVSGANSTTASFTGMLVGTPQYGFYPYNEAHKVAGTDMTFNLPSSYGDYNTEHSDKVGVPMLAEITDTQATGLNLDFKHLGGAILFKIDNVPANTAQFVFTANSRITGDFKILPGVDGNKIIALPTDEENVYNQTVTLRFKPSTEARNMTFIIPLPTGTYKGFKIELKDKDEKSLNNATIGTTNALNRTTLAIIPKITFPTVNGSLEDLGEEDDKEAIEVTPTTIESVLANAVDGNVYKLSEGEYTIPAGVTNKEDLTFIGADDPAKTIIKFNTASGNDNAFQYSTVTFKNLTINAASERDKHLGFGHCDATYKNCIINGEFTLYQKNDENGKNAFENCTFNVSGEMYNVWTYGVDVTFTNCKFNCDGKAVLIYNHSGDTTDCVTFNSCTFKDNDGLANETKAAIEAAANQNTVEHTIYINNCTVIGFANTEVKTDYNHGGTDAGTNVWGNKNMMTADKLNVFIDGKDVY